MIQIITYKLILINIKLFIIDKKIILKYNPKLTHEACWNQILNYSRTSIKCERWSLRVWEESETTWETMELEREIVGSSQRDQEFHLVKKLSLLRVLENSYFYIN